MEWNLSPLLSRCVWGTYIVKSHGVESTVKHVIIKNATGLFPERTYSKKEEDDNVSSGIKNALATLQRSCGNRSTWGAEKNGGAFISARTKGCRRDDGLQD
eukprot:14981856-Ditylum_brightwellii.AAC.1